MWFIRSMLFSQIPSATGADLCTANMRMANRLCSSASPDVYGADSISARPELAENESHTSEITKLKDNMNGIKAFLAHAERRRLTDQSMQRWVMKLREAMYKAEDVLDLWQFQQLEADVRRESSKGGGSKETMFAHKIGSHIKELNQRLDEIYKGAAEFNFIANLSSYQDQRMFTDVEQNSSLKKLSKFDETAIVGENIERDSKELAQVLIADHNQDLKVVPIIGFLGMGKTTLAQKIVTEATIHEHFKTRIWLSIAQHFDEGELLRAAITHAWGHHHQGAEQDRSKLVHTLTNILSAGKFLIVLDDVWKNTAWDHVLSVPIKTAYQKQPGSRVLVTTRFDDLALKMRASLNQHRVRPLHEEDAWTLLKKQLPLDQEVEIDPLKSIAMEILKECDGLPLAIKVIGGLLRTCPSEREWKALLNDPVWSADGLSQELYTPLFFSYKDVTPQLKHCFLYCSVFPIGTSMCISEGSAMNRNRFGDTFACLKSMAPKTIFDMAERSCSSPSPIVCGPYWISATPKSGSPNFKTDSEFNTGKSFGSWNELAENESHPRGIDSSSRDDYLRATQKCVHMMNGGEGSTDQPRYGMYIIDHGAALHCTGDRNLLSEYTDREQPDGNTSGASGTVMPIHGVGSICNGRFQVKDVKYIPSLNRPNINKTIFSVSELGELGYTVHFNGASCSVVDNRNQTWSWNTKINNSSHVMLAPKYLSVRHPVAQMLLFACNWLGDTFACLKSMVPKSIFDMAKRLCSSASPILWGADWISARPKSESPSLRTDSEFNTGKSFGSRNELAENESHRRAEYGINGGKAMTSADWVVATAAPHHATGNRNLLSGFVIEHDDQFILAVDGIPMKVLARGAVVTDTMVLPDVWFVPGLRENLVSVSQLAELDYSVGFGFDECCIRSAASGQIMGKARLQERGQYVLDFVKVPLAI